MRDGETIDEWLARVKVARERRAKRQMPIRYPGAEKGVCCMCSLPVLKSDGSPRRARWHEDCLHEYKIANQASYAREVIFRRDRGYCRACGVLEFRWKRGPVIRTIFGRGAPQPQDTTQGPYCDVEFTEHWHLDHIVPLADGGQHGVQNLQTLCPACHKIKTAHEATIRSQRRKVGR